MRGQLFILTLLAALQAQAMTFPQQALKPYDCQRCESLPRETLSTSWPTNNNPLGHKTKHQQKSRKYKIKTTFGQLKKGVVINTQAPGAIIRITPLNRKLPAKPDFRIKNSKGVDLTLIEASALFSKEEALQNTIFNGRDLILLQLKPELGAGEFVLSSSTPSLKDDEGYLIHVFDKDAKTYLHVKTDKAHYQYGDELVVTISFQDDEQHYRIDAIDASLVNANGDTIPLNLEKIENEDYEGHATLLCDKDSQGGNWYVEVKTTATLNAQTVKRQGHSAFSYIIPSAAIREIKKAGTTPLTFSARVEAATDSRYALQVVLYGSDKAGKIHPMQTAQTAAWLTAGMHDLDFSFDSELKSNYKAPYYLGYVHLTDLGQLKQVFEFNTPIALTKLGE